MVPSQLSTSRLDTVSAFNHEKIVVLEVFIVVDCTKNAVGLKKNKVWGHPVDRRLEEALLVPTWFLRCAWSTIGGKKIKEDRRRTETCISSDLSIDNNPYVKCLCLESTINKTVYRTFRWLCLVCDNRVPRNRITDPKLVIICKFQEFPVLLPRIKDSLQQFLWIYSLLDSVIRMLSLLLFMTHGTRIWWTGIPQVLKYLYQVLWHFSTTKITTKKLGTNQDDTWNRSKNLGSSPRRLTH